jgi:hypothetical protein
MMPLAEVFVHVAVLIDDALVGASIAVPRHSGPAPACSDAEVLTLALVRHLLARPSERAWLAEVRREWGHSCPHLPSQSEFNRRVRWLWGAFEQLRQPLLSTVIEDDWQQMDTTALPVRQGVAGRVVGQPCRRRRGRIAAVAHVQAVDLLVAIAVAHERQLGPARRAPRPGGPPLPSAGVAA